MLVQGWFVLNSCELYPANDTLEPGQVDPLEVQRGRDYILCHYALYKGLNKNDTFQLLKLTTRQFNEVFSAVSSFHFRDKHCFKYAEDSIFIKEHAPLCRKHNLYWNEVGTLNASHFLY